MQNFLRRLQQPWAHSSRSFSTARATRPHRTYFLPHGVNFDVIALMRKSHALTADPIWKLINKLIGKTTPLPSPEVLYSSGISSAEYELWSPAVCARNFDEAMVVLRANGFAMTPSGQLSRHLPIWLVILLLATKMKTHSQARLALSLAISHLPVTPIRLQPLLLILAAYALGHHNLPALLNPLVTKFLETPLIHNHTLYFNHLLQAISRLPSSWEASRMVASLIYAMSSRQLELWPRTYKYLLSDRFVTLELAKMLRKKMDEETVTPVMKHLEAFFRLFSRAGMKPEAGIYLDAIRKRSIEMGREVVPYGTYPPSEPSPFPEYATRHHTTYLTSFKDETSVNEYLGHLSMMEKNKDSHGILLPLGPANDIPPRRRALFHRNRLDIYHWTTAMSIAVRNPRADIAKLWSFFRSDGAEKSSVLRPTVATFTVFMKAFFDRGDYSAAAEVWDELLLRRPRTLDREALTVGIQILTMSGRPRSAFDIMNLHVLKRCEPEADKRHIKPDPCVINAFMQCMIRIRRPDVVFRLWDNMETLYGLRPDFITLNLLMEAALLASKLDDTISGFFAQLKLKSPFRRSQPTPVATPTTRDEVVEQIRQTIVDRKSAGSVGIWNDEPAWHVVRRIFHEVVLGNWPELMHVQPPARPLRTSGDEPATSPMRELARSVFISSAPRSTESNPTSSEEEEEEAVPTFGSYPQIIPTDSSFCWYIVLCGMHSVAEDIPLALAWMRALGVRPHSKTLSRALAFWGEVSMNAPLLDRMMGSREYDRLRDWMMDWVGQKALPRPSDIHNSIQVISQMRQEKIKAGT